MKKALYLGLFLMVLALLSGALISFAYELTNRNKTSQDDKNAEILELLGVTDVATSEEALVENVTYLRTGKLDDRNVVIVFVKKANSFVEIEIAVIFDADEEVIYDVVFITGLSTHAMDGSLKEVVIGALDKGDGIIENATGATVSTSTLSDLLAAAIAQFQALSGFPVILTVVQNYDAVTTSGAGFTVTYDDGTVILTTLNYTTRKLTYVSGLPDGISDSNKEKYLTVLATRTIRQFVYGIEQVALGYAISVYVPNEDLGNIKVVYTIDASGIVKAVDFLDSEIHSYGLADEVKDLVNAIIDSDNKTIGSLAHATNSIYSYQQALKLALEALNEVK